MKKTISYFTKAELLLWSLSVSLILLAFFLFDRGSYLSPIASLIGVTSLIYCAKGNPVGQLLMIIFSGVYGYISFGFAYYGEMMTYLGMTLPMAVVSLVSWLRHPYGGNKAEVSVNQLKRREVFFMLLAAAVITFIFYFILKACHTANLFPSTVSVATSFIAVYLTARRSPYYALGYAANDVVLIVLWGLASLQQPEYISVLVCFSVFLANDLYGFASWQKMQRRQQENRVL